ncbi:hypothetical protein ACP4OV_014325 [Aristida adscensionis]
MAQERSDAPVASSRPPPPPPLASSSSTSSAAVSSSWWREMHPAYAASSTWPPPPAAAVAARWTPLAPTHQHQQLGRTSSSGADDDLSASNATMTSFANTSGISMDSSMPGEAAEAGADAAESHLWNQALMGAGGEVGRCMEAVHDGHEDSENFLDLLNSRTLAPAEVFAGPPACDYLKKMESGSRHGGSSGGWPHQFSASLGGTHAHEHHHNVGVAAPEPVTANLSDMVSNWTLAPPIPCGATALCDNAAAVAAMGHGAKAGLFLDSGGHDTILQEAAGSSSTGNGQEYLRCIGNSSMLGLRSDQMYDSGGAADVPWGNNTSTARSLSDLISFGCTVRKPEPAKMPAEYKKQRQEISSPAKTSSAGGSKRSSAAREGRKRSEEQQESDGNAKKSKNDTSSPTSALKSQVPKVKLGDKITALQQIVSPFGKTDTASVLYEAINYIKWLHEQVQLLSDPYMKTSSSKDYNTWGGLDNKKSEADLDLRSRGLCLVPVSCTAKVYRDSNSPDYWTPPYRSCLYR